MDVWRPQHMPHYALILFIRRALDRTNHGVQGLRKLRAVAAQTESFDGQIFPPAILNEGVLRTRWWYSEREVCSFT